MLVYVDGSARALVALQNVPDAALRKVQALVDVEPSARDRVVTDTISGLTAEALAASQAAT